MNSPGQGLQKLEHYWQTDRQTDTQTDGTEGITTPRSPVDAIRHMAYCKQMSVQWIQKLVCKRANSALAVENKLCLLLFNHINGVFVNSIYRASAPPSLRYNIDRPRFTKEKTQFEVFLGSRKVYKALLTCTSTGSTQWRRQLLGTCPPRLPTVSFLVHFRINLRANYPSTVYSLRD